MRKETLKYFYVINAIEIPMRLSWSLFPLCYVEKPYNNKIDKYKRARIRAFSSAVDFDSRRENKKKEKRKMAGDKPKVYLDENYGLYYEPGTTMVDGAPEEVLAMSDEHWHQFPPNHPLIQHFFGLCFFLLWMVSFIGNGCVIYIFLKVKHLRTPSNMLVVTLALSDFIMMNTQGPPLFINVFISKMVGIRTFGLRTLWILGWSLWSNFPFGWSSWLDMTDIMWLSKDWLGKRYSMHCILHDSFCIGLFHLSLHFALT